MVSLRHQKRHITFTNIKTKRLKEKVNLKAPFSQKGAKAVLTTHVTASESLRLVSVTC